MISVPITITLSDEAVAVLVAALGRVPSASGPPATTPANICIELPAEWTHLEDLPKQSYRWPNRVEPETYDPFSVYRGETSAGSIQIAIGTCERERVWGQGRPYLITFFVSQGGGKRPISEFLRDDEGGYVSVIKGNGENRRSLFGADEELPTEYGNLPVAMYPERVHAKGVWSKKVVVAGGPADLETILNHSLIQSGLRFGISPS